MDKPKERKRSLLNYLLIAMVGLVILVVAWWHFSRGAGQVTKLKYGEFKQILRNPGISMQKVVLGQADIAGELVARDEVSDGAKVLPEEARTYRWFTTRQGLNYDEEIYGLLDASGPDYQGDDENSPLGSVGSLLMTTLMMGAFIFMGFLMIRWMAGGQSPFSFGRSRHKIYAQKDLHVTFADVAGVDEAVAELREVVDFLKKPDKYQALGGRIPKGVLLVGPPGTGKTLLAKAVAGEANAPFFSLNGSEFVEMFVGVGAARVRDLFSQAESRAPCIIFIDELDALGKTRSATAIGGHDEREQTLNQLLVEMDGFNTNRGVIIMAATNRPEMLDPALLRPGRFDRTVVVDRPDIVGREAILKVHARNVKVGTDVDLRHVASLTPGSVGADLANLVNEAALMAARSSQTAVGMKDFDEAVERMAVGLERKSRIMHEDEKRRVAYHEAGHALVACALPNTDPVHKVSIIPRGVGALGYTLSRPEDDRHLMTQSQLENHVRILLGGTIAEELAFGEISNGATSDLEKASRIARQMVKEFGMSRMGRVYFREQEGTPFLPGALMPDSPRDYSEQTACSIDGEVRKIIDNATEDVRTLLQAHRHALETVSRKLVECEVLDGAEVRKLLKEGQEAAKHEGNGVDAAGPLAS